MAIGLFMLKRNLLPTQTLLGKNFEKLHRKIMQSLLEIFHFREDFASIHIILLPGSGHHLNQFKASADYNLKLRF